MNSSFGQLVEEVRQLPMGAKEELKYLLEQSLLEERRAEIFQNFRESQTELMRGKFKFSSDAFMLRKSLAIW